MSVCCFINVTIWPNFIMEKQALKDAFSQTRKQASDLSASGLHTHIKTNTMCAPIKLLMTQEIEKWIAKARLMDTKGHNMSFWGEYIAPSFVNISLTMNEQQV